jgi:hypothetical protein
MPSCPRRGYRENRRESSGAIAPGAAHYAERFAPNCRREPIMNATATIFRRTVAALAASMLVVLGGCATTPAPTEQMAVSRAAIDDAISAGSAEYAPAEFRVAQRRLSAANAAFAAGEYGKAKKMAEDAEVDAKLAATTARSIKAQRAAAEVRESIRALQAELNRR